MGKFLVLIWIRDVATGWNIKVMQDGSTLEGYRLVPAVAATTKSRSSVAANGRRERMATPL